MDFDPVYYSKLKSCLFGVAGFIGGILIYLKNRHKDYLPKEIIYSNLFFSAGGFFGAINYYMGMYRIPTIFNIKSVNYYDISLFFAITGCGILLKGVHEYDYTWKEEKRKKAFFTGVALYIVLSISLVTIRVLWGH